jgi:hypothetical protein
LDRVLGLIILAFYVVAIIGFAGLMTYAVVRVFPTQDTSRKRQEPPSDDGTGVGAAAGRLYRKAKRESA